MEKSLDAIRRRSADQSVLSELEREREEHSAMLLTHGDFCIPNLLIRDGRLSGIIDWGNAGAGDIYRDLSAAQGSLLRNLGYDGMPELFSILGMDLGQFSLKKMDFYKKIDQFWYQYQGPTALDPSPC